MKCACSNNDNPTACHNTLYDLCLLYNVHVLFFLFQLSIRWYAEITNINIYNASMSTKFIVTTSTVFFFLFYFRWACGTMLHRFSCVVNTENPSARLLLASSMCSALSSFHWHNCRAAAFLFVFLSHICVFCLIAETELFASNRFWFKQTPLFRFKYSFSSWLNAFLDFANTFKIQNKTEKKKIIGNWIQ